jgi:hypothetical protein
VYAVVEFNVAKGLSWSVSFSTDATLVLAIFLAAIVPARKMVGWARGALPLSDTTLDQAREDLAQTLASGWTEEERLRRINDPWPLPVRWSGAGTGEFSEIGQFFNGAASRRLVILGQAGAGKTALAVKLVLELLGTREAGDPVPVLLAAGTWTDSVTMTDWIAQQLAFDHPGLAVAIRTGIGETVSLARSLAASEVLPVIDGLDELPESRRALVIAEINAQGSDRSVVLTSRPAEYQAAIASREVTLATTISLDSLEVSQVRDYLTAATEAPQDRWYPVFGALEADPRGPLALALTNPLMLWLARTVYEHGETQPGELTRIPDRAAVEGHLLAGFVPAAYESRSRMRGARGFRCTSAQAQRWFGFLAAWLNQASSSPDITWWRLCLAEPGWSALSLAIRSTVYTCVMWLAITWALVRRGYWHPGAQSFHGHFRDLVLAGPLGRSVLPLTGSLARLLAPVSVGSVNRFLGYIVSFGLARAAAVVFLLTFAVGLVPAAPGPQTPRVTFRIFRTEVLWEWVSAWILVYAWWGSLAHHEPLSDIAPQWRTKLVLICFGILTARRILSSLAAPVDVSMAPEPAGLLRRTRWVFLLGCLADAAEVAIVWLWAGTTFAIAFAIVSVTRLVTVSEGDDGGAWPRYLHAKFRLSARRRLPWRTNSFLADAHRRGVLRQVGTAYQFRHIRLQEQLAQGYSPWPPLLAPAAAQVRTAVEHITAFAQEKAATWRTSTQVVTTEVNTVSGVIPVLSASRVVRMQLLASGPGVAVGVILAMLAAIVRWYLCYAGLLLIGGLLLVSVLVQLHREKAGAGVVPGAWSVRPEDGGVLVTRDGVTMSLKTSDIERVTIRHVRRADGSATKWTALHARLRKDVVLPIPIRKRSLPLVWLWTKPVSGGARSNPQLLTSIRWFPDEVLSAELTTLKRVTAREYIVSGVVQNPPVPWMEAVLPAFAVSLALLVFSQRELGVLCIGGSVLMLGICVYRLSERAALHELTQGPWSLRVTPDGIDIEVNGTATHLAPNHILEADLRALRGEKGKDTIMSAVQVRLRPGAPAVSLTRDGWLPVYRNPIALSSQIPTELVAALHGLVGPRLGPRLTSLAKSKEVIQNN